MLFECFTVEILNAANHDFLFAVNFCKTFRRFESFSSFWEVVGGICVKRTYFEFCLISVNFDLSLA